MVSTAGENSWTHTAPATSTRLRNRVGVSTDEVACQATVTATQEGYSSSEGEGLCLHMSQALGLTVTGRETLGFGSEE